MGVQGERRGELEEVARTVTPASSPQEIAVTGELNCSAGFSFSSATDVGDANIQKPKARRETQGKKTKSQNEQWRRQVREATLYIHDSEWPRPACKLWATGRGRPVHEKYRDTSVTWGGTLRRHRSLGVAPATRPLSGAAAADHGAKSGARLSSCHWGCRTKNWQGPAWRRPMTRTARSLIWQAGGAACERRQHGLFICWAGRMTRRARGNLSQRLTTDGLGPQHHGGVKAQSARVRIALRSGNRTRATQGGGRGGETVMDPKALRDSGTMWGTTERGGAEALGQKQSDRQAHPRQCSMAAPPWALTATLESAYRLRPMGAQHPHEEGGLGSKPCLRLQEGSSGGELLPRRVNIMHPRASHGRGTRALPSAACEGANVDKKGWTGDEWRLGRGWDIDGRPAIALDGTTRKSAEARSRTREDDSVGEGSQA